MNSPKCLPMQISIQYMLFFGFNSPKEWKVDEGSYSHLIDKCCDVDSPGESKRQLKWGTQVTRMQYHMQK